MLQFKLKGDTIHLAQGIWFDSRKKKYFYIYETSHIFKVPFSWTLFLRKLPRIKFYSRKIKYVKISIDKSEKLVGDYSQWMKDVN